MFKTKAKKMREVVERQLYMINAQLNNREINQKSIVDQTLIAQKVTVEEILRYFDRIES